MTKTTRIVCLCILGAVGTLCGVSTINAPITEDKTELITPTEPLRSAYIVADITMQDPVAISLQGELYALERRVLAEYNGDNTLFTSRADVLRLDEGRYSFSSRDSVSRHIECPEKTSIILHSKI
jgi:hypothetical protein